ncbi:hypothetical protein LX36DRAFT_687207 [Colletotrichum falcatum]|nr:hypothetical protein LX36DRAFT_687207 [Colletotrichum falcatum]
MSTFQYAEALKHSEIRLLLLHPGEWLEGLETTLYVAEADRLGQYTALPYAWGSTRTCNQIIINGKVHDITFNLDRALRTIRQRIEPVVLWVDSICINQYDAMEKSLQVGSRKDYSRRFEKLRQNSLLHLAGTLRDKTLGMNDSSVDSHLTALTTNHSAVDQRIQPMAHRIRLFATSYWWNRMWIIQEACIAKNLTIAYGRVKLPFTFIADATENFRQLSSSRSKDLSQVTSYLAGKVHAINTARFIGTFNAVYTTIRSPLLRLLRRFRRRKSHEPRNEVFALLRLAQYMKKQRVFEHSDTGIRANYNIYAPGSLFTEVARLIILRTGLTWMATSSDNMTPGIDQRRSGLHEETSLQFVNSSPLVEDDPDNPYYQILSLFGFKSGLIETVSEVILGDLSNIGPAMMRLQLSKVMKKFAKLYLELFLDSTMAATGVVYNRSGRNNVGESNFDSRRSMGLASSRLFYPNSSTQNMTLGGVPAWTPESYSLMDEAETVPKDLDPQNPWKQRKSVLGRKACVRVTRDDVYILEGGLMPYILHGYTGSLVKAFLTMRRKATVGSCYAEGTMHWVREAGQWEDGPRDTEDLGWKLRTRLHSDEIFRHDVAII